MKIVIGILSLTLAAIPAIAAAQPNILVILTDDAGYVDFGVQGGGCSAPIHRAGVKAPSSVQAYENENTLGWIGVAAPCAASGGAD